MLRRTSAIATLTLLAACTPTDAPVAEEGITFEDEAAIRAVLAAYDSAWSAHDLDAAVANYADDYVEMRPNPIVGKDSARARYGRFTMTYTDVRSTINRLEGNGRMAYVWTTGEFRYTAANGDRRAQTANTVWVLRKDDQGQWKAVAGGFQASTRPDTTAAGQSN